MDNHVPDRYAGTGVTCSDAMFSMQRASGITQPDVLWWWCALKYLWRWWEQGGKEDLDKAIDCIARLKEIAG